MSLHVHHQQQHPVPISQIPPLPHSPSHPPHHVSHILPPSPPVKVNGRKRKKTETPDEKPRDLDTTASSASQGAPDQQPPARRLRRLHEACARCRSKKIKCDSKLPSCSACATANVECNQEDRHRQTLKPRGHADMVESQLSKCVLLIQNFIPGFKADDIDVYLAQHGIAYVKTEETNPPMSSPTSLIISPSVSHPNNQPLSSSLARAESAPAQPPSYESASENSSTTAVDGFPRAQSSSYSDPRPSPQSSNNVPPPVDVKGQDPQANDLSSTGGLIKAFGVSKSIVRDLKPESGMEGEDVLGGVRMYNDPLVSTYPKRGSQWTARPLNRRGFTVTPLSSTLGNPNTASSSTFILAPGPRNLAFHLPRDRAMTEYICNCYFSRLNWHRPVFEQADFMAGIAALYDSIEKPPAHPDDPIASTSMRPPSSSAMGTHGTPFVDDPGFLCSAYLILALGTLSEMNHHLHQTEGMATTDLTATGFPTHEEFFELALAVKPDLRVTISSLQALILLQWYLYTERHGRTLWRLVGNLVRLSIELGLHHDPSEQGSTFTPAECELRTRLWWIVMIHDRGTSVLLGRPLAIADADFNTPFPKRFGAIASSPFSEHFDHSPYLTGIQGDIINALYRPGNHKQSGDQVLRHASRITKSFLGFRGLLPDSYRAFFEGTATWSEQDRIALVTNISADQGLTMLKYGIARILLLRALFTSGQLSGEVRRRALKDAVIASHNILIIQNQLISYPSLAFFVSPIPIHIAAMVILYGVISECDALSYAKAKEDVCIALQLVPLFRWRWIRKDSHGSHPLITKLAQKVFGSDVLNVSGPTGPPMLIPEWDWSVEESLPPQQSPSQQQQQGSVSSTALMHQVGHQHQHHQHPSGLGQANGPTRMNSTGVMYDQPSNGQYPSSSSQQVHGHSRHSSAMSGMPPTTPASATGPGGPSLGASPHMIGQLPASSGIPPQHQALGASGPSNPGAPTSGYSPPHQADTPGSGGFHTIPIDDAERDVIVRFMYPPPLPDSPTNYFHEAQGYHPHNGAQHIQHIAPPFQAQSLASPSQPQQNPSQVHIHHQQQHPHANHHPHHPRHPHSHPHPDATGMHHLLGTLQPVMYADFNQAENYYVEEQYDGNATNVVNVGVGIPVSAIPSTNGSAPSSAVAVTSTVPPSGVSTGTGDVAMKTYSQQWS